MSPQRQRAVALSKANNVRSKRGAEKRRITTLPRQEARERVAELIENPPPEFKSARLGELLGCIRSVGHGLSIGLLSRYGLHLDVRLRELKVWERLALGEELRSGRGFPQSRRAA